MIALFSYFMEKQQLSISRRLRYLTHRVVCILADAFCYKRQLRNQRSSFYNLWCESSMPIH
ncbi:hypothetical protein OUZ56_011800 [Daphnia magna]|uniref:Uncharacterized protein n=1 Tax=Daphnia magna TaxID=35525 RepID=A0ABQ9Z171_9CRUS|nr:hypothetical protein OUZ56_011800 [Daphnia magna]